MLSSQPASSSLACSMPLGCADTIDASFSIVLSFNSKRGECGWGPGLAFTGFSGGLSPLFKADLTSRFQLLSTILAKSAASLHLSSSACAICRRGFSAFLKGFKTASIAGLFPALGKPMHMTQIIGGSVHPRQGVDQRALPIKDPATDSNAPNT